MRKKHMFVVKLKNDLLYKFWATLNQIKCLWPCAKTKYQMLNT